MCFNRSCLVAEGQDRTNRIGFRAGTPDPVEDAVAGNKDRHHSGIQQVIDRIDRAVAVNPRRFFRRQRAAIDAGYPL